MKKRPICALFYRHSLVVQNNRSSCSNNAVVNAIRHMQTNRYDANVCEVFNTQTGKLYAVIKWTKVGKQLDIMYRDTIEEFNHGN